MNALGCPPCTINFAGSCESCPPGSGFPECRGCAASGSSFVAQHWGKLTVLALFVGLGVWALATAPEPASAPRKKAYA